MTSTTPATTGVPRLYWCPTGPAVFLPLHAAGHHQPTGTSAPLTVIDNTESVYIPKLRTLYPVTEPATSHKISPAPLIVSMPTTPSMPPLPTARPKAIAWHPYSPTPFISPECRHPQRSAAQMGTHSWHHFAVHGITDNDTPVNGGLELTDGRLTILDLLQRHLTDTQFAYLSACETYQNAPAIPDEAITVATALHIAGCQTVIAALWQSPTIMPPISRTECMTALSPTRTRTPSSAMRRPPPRSENRTRDPRRAPSPARTMGSIRLHNLLTCAKRHPSGT